MRLLRLLLFALALIVLWPLMLTGMLAYLVRLKLYNQPRGVSGTAYEPLFNRALAHGMGSREDEPAYRLGPMLPALTPLIWWLIMWPFVIASRVARYQPVMLCGPVTRPATPLMLMSLRNDIFDGAFDEARESFDQIVILGAGWDTRAYQGPTAANVRIFEVDTGPTLAAKVAALREADLDFSHVTFVETEFNQVSWAKALQNHGFDPALRTLVLWEGVSMYLTAEAVNETLSAVSGFGAGSQIAFDYLAKEFIDHEGGYRFLARYVNWMIGATYGERFTFGIPLRQTGSLGVQALLESNGLQLKHFDMVGSVGQLGAFYGFAVAETP